MEKETFLTDVCKRYFVAFVMAALFSFPAFAQIFNGDFSDTEPNQSGAVPIGWNTENYALVHNEFTPCFERGQNVHWSFGGNTVTSSQDGGYFLVLSTGDYEYDACSGASLSGRVDRGVASQECRFFEGQSIYGQYFFGTGDYIGWNDYAMIRLIPSDPNNEPRLEEIVVAYADVYGVGDFSSTDGWQKFSHTFTFRDQGSYYVQFEVYDVKDRIYKSYLMIDYIKCGLLPPSGDFNADGNVDYMDLAAFDIALYQDCSDPNDPNSICHYYDIEGRKQPFYEDAETQEDYRDQYGRTTMKALMPVLRNWLWNSKD